MEVHRQTCQACGSTEVHNIIAREEGRAQMIYVRCGGCGELVARYRLLDYYHHGKGLDSYLRSMGADASDSARHHLDEVGKAREEALNGYSQALAQLKEDGKTI